MGDALGRFSDLFSDPFLYNFLALNSFFSGPEKGVITKGVFPLEESLESLRSLNSLESLGNGPVLLCFPQSGGSLTSFCRHAALTLS